MFNTTQLLTIAGVPIARHVDVLDSLTKANEKARGLLFQKIKTRYLLADRLSKLLEWEDDRLCVKYPELIDHDVAPMLNIRLCGDNGPGTPGGSQPLSNCWLDRDPASDEYKDAVAHNYWCEGEHPRSRKSIKAQLRLNGGEGRAWRLGEKIDVANGFEIWRGATDEVDVKVFCASGAWLLLSTEPWYLGLRIARRIGFEIDNIFGGDDTPRRWFPIKGYELRAPVTSSVLPDQDRLDMSLKKWEKPYFVTDKETGNIYTAIPGDAITKDIY